MKDNHLSGENLWEGRQQEEERSEQILYKQYQVSRNDIDCQARPHTYRTMIHFLLKDSSFLRQAHIVFSYLLPYYLLFANM